MASYVFSTLTSPQEYTGYAPGPNGELRSVRSVHIAGGHGLMNKNFITPLGVMTEVSDDDMAFLETVDAFQLHRANGHIKVEKKSAAPEKIAADMNLRDESAPLTPADYNPGGRMGDMKAPTVTGGVS